jgi:hypothetical protein
MKVETKRKLIRLFHKLIRYDITKDTERTIQVKVIDILRVRWEQEYSNEELDWMINRKDVLPSVCASHLIGKLVTDDVIKITQVKSNIALNYTRVTAELNILLKK